MSESVVYSETCLALSTGNRKRKKVNLLAVTTELITPLHDAVMNNRLDVCKLLLQHGGTAELLQVYLGNKMSH